MPRYAVLGAGLMGRVIARDLLQAEPDARVTLMDVDEGLLRETVDPLADARLEAVVVDVHDVDEAAHTLAGHDVAVSALPHRCSLAALDVALAARVSIVDLVGSQPEARLELEFRARDAGILILPGCGVAPGLSNVFVGLGAERLDEVRDATIYVGGIPIRRSSPLEYETVYALESVLGACARPARILQSGREVEVEALSGLEQLDFAPPIGRLEAYYTDGLGSLILTMRGRITGSLVEKTLRYPGFAAHLAFLRACGLLETSPVRVGRVEVAPLDVLAHQLRPALRLGPEGDLLVLRAVVAGTRAGRTHVLEFELLDAYDATTGMTAMGRTTGFPAAQAARLIGVGRIDERGVRFPEQLFVGERGRAFLATLRDHGLAITERERT